MKVLLSIKPQYVEEILNGNKKYEYRKSIFKNTNVNTVVIYATKPVGKIVGEFTIDKVIEETPDNLWRKTKKYSGVSKVFYDSYFENRVRAFAIKIKEVREFTVPYDLKDYDDRINSAPQSYMYL